jgi:hypothetical protein
MELSWRRCFGYKIDWRRLFLLIPIFTVFWCVLQIFVHTYVIPPNKHLHFPRETDSSLYRSSNSTIRSNEFLKGAILQEAHLTFPYSVVSPNSTNKFVQSVSVEQDIVDTRAQRKKDKNVANTIVSSGKQVEVD